MIAQRDRRWLRPLREIRRSVLKESLRRGPLEGLRMGISVTLASFGKCAAKFRSPEL
jgi:hypothetical protein